MSGEHAGSQDFAIKVDEKTFDRLYLRLSGKISMQNAELVREELVAQVRSQPLKNVVIDLGAVEYFDSAGAAVLMEVQSVCRQLDNSLKLEHVPKRIQTFLDLIGFEEYQTASILGPRPAPSLLTQIGDGALKFYNNAVDILTFIGAAVVASAQDLARPRQVKWDPLWKLIERSGSDAIPIVTILNFLQGAILAFQAAIQLRKFGANIFVADLVSVSICLEMGPLLTALIVSGRSGAAYAAQIGTMQVNEEIDALRIMAIDPIRYLVVPRIIAVAFVLPCLTLFADLVGVVGGCIVAVVSLDLTPLSYFNQVHKILEVSDVVKGLVKSFTFGIEIAMIGCLRGFQVRGGAENVGRATTSAVVTCIFLLTVTDAFFAALFHYLPGVPW
ncbi:MAG: MlaE family lipid ABC transporter permease subunit [Desulfomonile tiedjei]|nr:MlaE family lipid ABC transporter permease subunit [Desulfomonile tiedjei]